MKQTIIIKETELKQMITEAVKNILNDGLNNNKQQNKREIFTVDAFDIENEIDVCDMQYCGQIYYNIDEAIKAAKKLAQDLIDYENVAIVTVYGGEYETDNGNIFGDPQDVYSISNSDKETTMFTREQCGYVNPEVNDYAV